MKLILFVLLGIIAFTALLSGLLLVSNPDGSILSLPLSLLEGTPFRNYFLPGMMLAVTVGGINMIAVFLNMQRHAKRYNWAMAGGFVCCAWIITQIILIGSVHWLHITYLMTGLLIILIAYHLKGKWAV